MRIARSLVFIFAMSVLLSGALLGMRDNSLSSNKKLKEIMQLLNVQGGACNDFDTVKKIMKLIKLEYSSLENVLSKNPESKKVFSRSLRNIITNMHPNCVKSETQRCGACSILLHSTVQSVRPFLNPLVKHYKKPVKAIIAAEDQVQKRGRSVSNFDVSALVCLTMFVMLAVGYESADLELPYGYTWRGLYSSLFYMLALMLSE